MSWESERIPLECGSPLPRRPPLRDDTVRHELPHTLAERQRLTSSDSSLLTATHRSHTSPFCRGGSDSPLLDTVAASSPGHATPLGVTDATNAESRGSTLIALAPLFPRHKTRTALIQIIHALQELRSEAERRLRLRTVRWWLRWAAQQHAVRVLFEVVCLPKCEQLAQLYFLRWRRLVLAPDAVQHYERATRRCCLRVWRDRATAAHLTHLCDQQRVASSLRCTFTLWRRRAREQSARAALVTIRFAAEIRLTRRMFYTWLLRALTPRLTGALMEQTARELALRTFLAWQHVATAGRRLKALRATVCCYQGTRVLSLWSLWTVRQRHSRQLARENAIRHARLSWCRWLLMHRRAVQRRRAAHLE